MRYDPDSFFSAIAAVASKGWKVVRLWGVKDDLTCTCGRSNCPTPGKHPSGGAGWQHRATDNEEEIAKWFEAATDEHTRCNVGLRLGPTSGVIDVEFDSPDAEIALQKYGLHLIDTPAYSSGRGVHRLFQHEDWMPDSAVVKVEGIEVRIGGGEMASQSVLPPSWHKSGKQYEWLPGKSPEEVNPAKLPLIFRDAVMAASRRQGSGIVAQSREYLRKEEKIAEGGRHAFLVGIASRNAARIREFSDNERVELTEILLALNATKCEPPKSRDEVVKIASDQFAYYRDRQIERRANRPYERYGLAWNNEDRCWEPGLWSMTVVHSDPREYKIRIPHLDRTQPAYTIRIGSKEFQSAKDVSNAILEVTGRINMNDPNPARWTAIWNGENIQVPGEGWVSITGLSCRLLADADDEYPPPEASATCNNYSMLLAYLSDFQKIETGSESDSLPNPSGAPKWIQSPGGEWLLWLQWRTTLAAAWRKASLPPPTNAQANRLLGVLRAEVGEERLKSHSKRIGEKVQKFFAFDDHTFECLRKLSGLQ